MAIIVGKTESDNNDMIVSPLSGKTTVQAKTWANNQFANVQDQTAKDALVKMAAYIVYLQNQIDKLKEQI